jgi:hypothetical protein
VEQTAQRAEYVNQEHIACIQWHARGVDEFGIEVEASEYMLQRTIVVDGGKWPLQMEIMTKAVPPYDVGKRSNERATETTLSSVEMNNP